MFDKDSWKNPATIVSFLKKTYRLKNNLGKRYYEVIVDLQGLLRSGLITCFTPGALKIGFADAREGSRLFYGKKVRTDGAVHAVDKNLLLAEAIGAKVKKVEFPLYVNSQALENVLGVLGNSSDKYIVVAPSSRWQSKQWPPEYFASLISKINIPVVITGSPSDMETAREITDAHPARTINLCGKTDLKELVALIAGSKAVVCNDSGPMHIAAALKRPVVSLFGPTDYEKTGPYGWQNNTNLTVIRASIPCSPCFKRKCNDPVCMEKISVETVYDSLKKYL